MPAIRFKISMAATQYIPYEPRGFDLMDRWSELMRELDMARLRLTWIPANVKLTPACTPKKRYQKMFTGMRFRIGGSKK